MSGPEQKPMPAATLCLDAEALALVDALAASYRLGRGELVLHALRSLRMLGDGEFSLPGPPPWRPPLPSPLSLAEEALEAGRAVPLAWGAARQVAELEAYVPFKEAAPPPVRHWEDPRGGTTSRVSEQERVAYQALQQLHELPHGVFEGADGSYRAKCRACGRDYELFGTPEEFTEEGNYCGGSMRCVP